MTQEPAPATRPGWRFWIDRGGTFTDIVAVGPDGRLSARKLLSENPARGTDAALAGIAEALGLVPGGVIPAGLVESVRMGTTVATNALLERRTARVLLLVDHGFADLLQIGDQSRPALFDLAITRPLPLHERADEITGRIDADGSEVAPLDEAAAQALLEQARADGIEACAIALIHAWRHPALECRLAALARAAGFDQVSVGHRVSPHLRLVPRAQTAVLDAALSPILRRHVGALAASLPGARLSFMQSHGGLADGARFSGCNAILSGPAGGIVGAARTSEQAGFDRIISFDMGGTSTDVALYAGAFERRFESRIDGLPVRVPMMAIHTVAAGGGSILRFDGTRLRVGPQSAGAVPGPRAYRNGGPLTVTDANLHVGNLHPACFPALFGPDGNQPLDDEAVRAGFEDMRAAIASETGIGQDTRTLAESFLRIAVANMAHAVREVSIRRGHDPAGFALACFGGAGGQHACQLAEALGIGAILVPTLAGVLSAYGMGLAEQGILREQSVEIVLDEAALPELSRIAGQLSDAAMRDLAGELDPDTRTRAERHLHLRQGGSDAIIIVALDTLDAMRGEFLERHHARFGFHAPGGAIIVDAVTVEIRALRDAPPAPAIPRRGSGEAPSPCGQVALFRDGAVHDAPLFERDSLAAGDHLAGPALIVEANATTVLEAGWTADITETGAMILRRRPGAAVQTAASASEPALIELFNNLFMNIAEQAGAVLQNTARSVNIRERLDFSCAIFDAEGALVANAPHVPVHLGAMGESVRTVLRTRAATLRPGDVIALNNPFNGGTHLPDVTVITPVFDPDGVTLHFFVAARGHHADIGSATPGSTPAFSRSLRDEGVVIDDFLLVEGGLVDGGSFREGELRALLATGPTPARSPDTNVADLRAQVAANSFAAAELRRALGQHGAAALRRAMLLVMRNAEESVRRAIATLHDGAFTALMDDGGRLRVAVRVNPEQRSAVIDFTGTSGQRADNFNAPTAVLRAVVLYVFRCLAGDDIPLNDGCLTPLRIVVPPGTFLSPSPGAAVVAGNTEVSQATCNALFAALGSMAAGQGTMNNLLFGDAERQYYETICGGAGAGPDFDGADAVQSHMTNTRMTDPEVLELRYPLRVERFSIRRGSGGDGARRGGCGAVRRLRFLEPMQAVLVASSRVVPPFGLAGGGPGARGRQWIDRADGSFEPLAGVAQMQLAAGDTLTVETPGGGGFGAP